MTDQPILDLPVHQNPTSAQRTACAPYNFVPLPETVVRAAESPKQLPGHDTYANLGYRHSGYFEVTLTTRSPLYVRCGLTREQYDQQQREGEARIQAARQRADAPEQYERQQREEEARPFREQVKNRPEFFYTADPAQPVIPGSSLRGMLRAVLEIVSYGKVQRVTDKELFFRSVDDSSLGYAYRQRMVGDAQGEKKVETGFLAYDGTGPTRTAAIAPCTALRVAPEQIFACFHNARHHDNDGLRLLRSANDYPDWRSYQYKQVWVRADERSAQFVRDMRTSCPKRNECTCDPTNPVNMACLCHSEGWQRGVLVVTGWAPKSQKRDKDANGATRMVETVKKEFVFLFPEQGQRLESIPVSEDILSRFTDDDQVTQWQEKAFRRNDPVQKCRERDGLLRKQPPAPGDPVFFLCEEGDLTFFGRAQMFRLPYQHNPRDLVHTDLWQESDVDYAEALFGYVKGKAQGGQQGEKRRAYAGRVAVTDAVWDKKLPGGATSPWLRDTAIVPYVLASPKPTAFQHYLVQYTDKKHWLMHYDRLPEYLEINGRRERNPNLAHNPWRDQTTIRGHKRYWHQGERSIGDIELPPDKLRELLVKQPEGKQFTQFRPMRANATFSFRVYFDNLSECELGALCWILHPRGPDGAEYAHSLGMGKSLGMGAVSLRARLHLIQRTSRDEPGQRTSRYATLFDDTGDWQTGADREGEDLALRDKLEPRVRSFEKHVLSALGQGQNHHLCDLRRVGMLLRLLEWPGVTPRPSTREDPYNHVRNSRTMRFDLPYGDRRDSNEFRSRPVLPDPSAFDRPLSGNLEPRPRTDTVRGDATARPGDVGAPTAAGGTSVVAGAMTQQVEVLQQGVTEQPAAPTFKHGDVVEAEVLQVNKAKGTIRVRLRLDGQELPAIKNVSRVLIDLDRLEQGSTITCKIEDMDPKSGKVQRASWKR